MQSIGLRQTLRANATILPHSVVVYHTTDGYVALPSGANAGNIAGVILPPFNRATIAAEDACAVVSGGEIVTVRKVSGSAIAAGEAVQIGDATGAITKATTSATTTYAVGFATQASASADVYAEIQVNIHCAHVESV